MLGSAVLDIGIGITMLFLLVSLICSAMREAMETFLKSRAMDLERGIREILHDKDGRSIASELYNHPFIYSLYAGQYRPNALKPSRFVPSASGSMIMPWRARGNLPAYIPSQAFSAALIDLIHAKNGGNAPLSIASLRSGAAEIENEKLRDAILASLNSADQDISKLCSGIESWYDATMDRVSGWYKRRTQYILLTFGLLAGVVFNIDPLHVARHLATDKAYRDAIVAQAPGLQAARNAPAVDAATAEGGPASTGSAPTLKDAVERMKTIERELDRSGFLLGWWPPQIAHCEATITSMTSSACILPATQMLFGWLVTAFAVSLGAPFWFDVLNKFMIVRSTVKPAEKSGEEGSKDSPGRQQKGLTVPLTFSLHQAEPNSAQPGQVPPPGPVKSAA